ncbi:ribonuclease HI [Novimethylophilus kurashikiensis]|uniref:Ribonuclease H n=1 Tax=Novimethylophilus kurashikiensis TaxID=1825523 RepID=A0A2R5FC42_9PROT|nr:ribonuclease H [Novimethylophilus kurashikiensis]GBG14271.1 ribonuclease HI [Novimethylophilus kurashikiensis]
MSNSSMAAVALAKAIAALELIAAPARPDGTYNRCREACEQLAQETLDHISSLMTTAAPAPAVEVKVSGRVLVYSDGGCKGNPGPAGWGVVVVDEATETVLTEAAGFIGVATNQVAEIVAATEGLSRVPEGTEIVLISDSQYTLKGLSEWRTGWVNRGWRTASGDPVANKEHWMKLFAVADKRKVTVRWVKGHAGDVNNERCDALAANIIASTVDI